MFTLTYWNSGPGSEALVIVAIQIICFFAVNPFLIALPDWRNTVREEAEALMHFSVEKNMFLKSAVTTALIVLISLVAFGCLQLVIDSLGGFEMWVSMLFDSASLTLPFICFGLYTSLPLQIVQILASMPFLCMIFFSTTFSPGAGIDGVKALRFLFARFYLWCRIPGIQESMEGCPDEDMLVWWTVATGLLGFVLFFLYQVCRVHVGARMRRVEARTLRQQIKTKPEFAALQRLLYRGCVPGSPGSAAKGSARAPEVQPLVV
jgi:hypothetical protein